MPTRPSYLPTDSWKRAQDLQFTDKVASDIHALTFPQMVSDGIDGLKQFGESMMRQADEPAPLPIVVSDRPQLNPVASEQVIPSTPSGTPSAMPSNTPRTQNINSSTITQGDNGPLLRPGESVGSVTLAGGNFTPEEQAAIQQAAQEEGVPADMIAAIWDTEQSGSDSVSSAGARGRGQVVPGQGYDLPGEDPSIPLHGARQTARALKDKYQNTGSWDEAGAAYFGYGTDSGGMDTDTYRERVKANRAKYQQAPPSAPQAQQQRSGPMPEDTPNGGRQTATSTYTQQGLADAGDPDAWAKCGPVAAFQFAQKMGRNPTPAEIERLARDAGWTPAKGMAGFQSEAAVLRGMGIAAREEQMVDWDKVITDVSRGNPVILQLPGNEGHYVTAQNYDPQTGKIDFGSTVGDLRAAGHKTQFTPSELENLGWGAPNAALYVDNPATPAPSVAADARQSLNAGPDLLPSGPAAPSPPQAAPGGLAPSGSVPAPTWSPDSPVGQLMPYQASAGRYGGQGVMMRAPLAEGGEYDPRQADEGPRELAPSTYNDPTAGGTISAPLPYNADGLQPSGGAPIASGAASSEGQPPPATPNYVLQDGRTTPPTPGGFEPLSNLTQPPQPYGPPLSEAGPEQAPQDQVSRYAPSYAPQAAQVQASTETPYRPVTSTPGEPDYVPPRSIPLTPQDAIDIPRQAARAAVDAGASSLDLSNPYNLAATVLIPGAGTYQLGSMIMAGLQTLGDAGFRRVAQSIGLNQREIAHIKSQSIAGYQTPDITITAEDLAGLLGQTITDPGTYVGGHEAKPIANAAVKAGQEIAENAAPAAREAARGAGRAGYALAEEGARQLMDMTPMPRVVPPGVSDTLGFPVRVPTDPSAIKAIEAIGGHIDPERGVTINVTRAQGPDSAGGVATRGGVFYEAVPEGGRSSFVRGSDDPTQVGGSQVIPATPTRFRSPLIVSDAPGGRQGFDEGMRQIGAGGEVSLELAAAQDAYKKAQAAFQAKINEDPSIPGEMHTDLANAWQAARERVRAAQANEPATPTYAGIENAVRIARQAGPEGSPARAEALKEVVRRFGGDEAAIEPLLAIRGAEASESAWAIRENILAAHARKNGYDGVVTVAKQEANEDDVVAHPAVAAARRAMLQANMDRMDAAPGPAREAADAVLRQATDTFFETQDAVRKELAGGKITELVDVREARNPTPGPENPRIAELQQELRRLDAERATMRESDPAWEQGRQRRNDLQREIMRVKSTEGTVGTPGYTLRDDLPRQPGAPEDPRFTTPKASGMLPFDPSSAAIGAGAGAETGEDGNPTVDPMRAAGGMAVAGIIGSFPGAKRALQMSQQRAARMAARGQSPLSPLQWTRKLAGEIGYSSMIGPATATVNLSGNALTAIAAIPKEIARAGVRGNLREAGTMAVGAFHGMQEVGQAVVDAMKAQGKYAPTPGHEPLSAQTINPIGHAIATGLEVGGRFWSGVPDAIFGTIAQGAGEARAAAQMATDAGLKGKAWAQHVQDLLADAKAVKSGQLPTLSGTQKVIDDAVAYAKNQTFQDELGTIGKNVRDFATISVIPDGKGGRKPIPVLGNMVMPFFNTPWNMNNRLMEQVPGVGALMNSHKGFDKAYDQVFGTVVLAGMVGYASTGNITGSGPSDKGKRDLLMADGWRPYSTLIDGVYIPNRTLGIYGPMLNAVGDAHDTMAYAKDASAGSQVSDYAGRLGKQLQQQPYLQGLSNLIAAISAGQQGGLGAATERYAASNVTRMVPYAATARTIGTMQDPLDRTSDQGKNVPADATFTQMVRSGVGNRQGFPGQEPLPVAQDVLGRQQANPQAGLGALFARTSTQKQDPAVRAFLDAGVSVGEPPNELSLGAGAKVPMSPAERRTWQTERGKLLTEFAGKFRDAPWWNNPDARAKAMQSLLNDANQAANGRLMQKIGAVELQRRVKKAS